MELIIKNTLEWMNLITRIRELKKVYGSDIIDQTIFLLENMQKNNLILVGHKALFLDVLVEHKIDDISLIIQFLNKIKNIYDLDIVLKKMEEAIDQYGINQVALILDQAYIRAINTYYFNHGFRKAYFKEGVIPKIEIDLKKNMNMINVFTDSEFIVDEQNFVLRKAQRIYYTSDFRFGSMTLPSKKEMDYIYFDDEKRIWLNTLIKEMVKIPIDHVVLELEDPNNQKYSLSYQFDYYQTIQTDGEIKDTLGGEVTNFYHNEDIVVTGADVLMICEVEKGEVVQVKLNIHPTYFKRYMQQLNDSQDKYLLNIIYQLLDHTKRNALGRK